MVALRLGILLTWLLEKKIKTCGDWKIKNKNAEPGCWSFEFYNKFYPDVDDTAIVCKALEVLTARTIALKINLYEKVFNGF